MLQGQTGTVGRHGMRGPRNLGDHRLAPLPASTLISLPVGTQETCLWWEGALPFSAPAFHEALQTGVLCIRPLPVHRQAHEIRTTPLQACGHFLSCPLSSSF